MAPNPISAHASYYQALTVMVFHSPHLYELLIRTIRTKYHLLSFIPDLWNSVFEHRHYDKDKKRNLQRGQKTISTNEITYKTNPNKEEISITFQSFHLFGMNHP